MPALLLVDGLRMKMAEDMVSLATFRDAQSAAARQEGTCSKNFAHTGCANHVSRKKIVACVAVYWGIEYPVFGRFHE